MNRLYNWKFNNFSRERPFFYFALFTLISIAIRLPFFFRDYVDRDESTFILMGQAWLDGYLPYTFLWDVKPPLTFLFYTLVIFLFGKSFFMLRLIGAILVATTSYFSFAIAKKYSGLRAGILAGIASIYLQSLFGSIQGVMSEHLIMFFFMAALFLLSRRLSLGSLMFTGILFGISLMIKISIAFPILLIGMYFLYYFSREFGFGGMVSRMTALVLPAVLVLLLTLMPYIYSGQMSMWWESVVQAPLAYTEAGRTSTFNILLVCLPIVIFIYWAAKQKRIDLKDPHLAVIVVSVLGMLISFLKGGRINSHYLIQLYPPLLVLVAIAIAPMLDKLKAKTVSWIVVLLLLIPAESYLEYWRISANKINRGTFYNGEGFTVPDYLVKNNIDTRGILFLGYHIGYWVLDEYPPTKSATHPSNICKAEMFPYYNKERSTAIEELRYIMEDLRPPVVIVRSNRRVFDRLLVKENAYIDSVLQTNYILKDSVDKADVYLRSDGL